MTEFDENFQEIFAMLWSLCIKTLSVFNKPVNQTQKLTQSVLYFYPLVGQTALRA